MANLDDSIIEAMVNVLLSFINLQDASIEQLKMELEMKEMEVIEDDK